jgi:uncharacterized protein (DUF427 family)
MLEQTIRVPDAHHPIAIERNRGRVVVTVDGQVIADTRRALTLREAGLEAVTYIPRADVRLEALERSPTATYCPYKGEATHFTITSRNRRSADACWSYRSPYWAVAEIENHLAFDRAGVDLIEEC